LFLSFAADDSVIAEDLAEWLSQQPGITICSERGTRADDPEEAERTVEQKIARSQTFLAIMSPSYLASPACRRERVVALHREPVNQDNKPPSFISVFEVRPTQFLDAGAFSPRHWVTMTGAGGKDAVYRQLHAKLTATPIAASPAQENVRHKPPSFHNRQTELDEIVDELISPTGQRFWRVIAAPQLGKSWFLDRVDLRLEERARGTWSVRLVDVREKPREVRGDAGSLLGMFFGLDRPVATDQPGLEKLARTVLDAGKPHLCLLDSAELLDPQVTIELRKCLSQVYEQVERARKKGVRLALIVATRGKGWDGITPQPRLRLCRLSQFTLEVVVRALEDMREDMGYEPLPASELQQYAEHVHRLSEGLPALLYRYLDWIHGNSWVGLDHLREERQFDVLTQPYIEELLHPGSLFGPGAALTDELRLCAREALQLLVPYRLYTHAHLGKHLERGGDLYRFAETMGWDVEKLISALSSTDLNERPQKEIWEVIYAPIRRLLCRYWYPSDESLADAHSAAGQFVRARCDTVTGLDRTAYFVECLWHKSQLLILNRAVDAQEDLKTFARDLSRDLLTASPDFSSAELRNYAASRMRDDEELTNAVRLIRVSYEELVSIVGGNQP
jgi:hypothetical protein